MAENNSFLERDADGRWFRIAPVGGRRVKVTDIMSPTGVFWYEDFDNIGVKIWPQSSRPGQGGDCPVLDRCAPVVAYPATAGRRWGTRDDA